MKPETLGIALWAENLAHPINGLRGWLSLVESQIVAAKGEGAKLFVLPEYTSAHWLAWAPPQLKPTETIAWMAEIGEEALAQLGQLARRYDIGIVAGSMPVAHEGKEVATAASPYVNRAWILLPEGDGTMRRTHHDKLVLTPSECDPENWLLATGNKLRIYEWRGLRFAVLICLDVEMPGLAVLLAKQDIDLLIVPSMTSRNSGFHRVFDCAKARAVELYCVVAVVGGIGDVKTPAGVETNFSGAACFVPCDVEFGTHGVMERVAPAGAVQGPGPMLVTQLPVAAIFRSRRKGGEVWPGAFDTGHIETVPPQPSVAG
ncbi:MAG TPA: nitrilase-related carbon-nitrogen hydrolase [Terriglobales bacterium]|nr:nitrilase-related carbon-nitrogen hydrolase [Terriglobales bacterium]